MSLPNHPALTVDDITREAARYVAYNLGDQLWVGTPIYNAHHAQWVVPLHARSFPADIVLGEMTLDADGHVIHAPSRDTLQRTVRQYQQNNRQNGEA